MVRPRAGAADAGAGGGGGRHRAALRLRHHRPAPERGDARRAGAALQRARAQEPAHVRRVSYMAHTRHPSPFLNPTQPNPPTTHRFEDGCGGLQLVAVDTLRHLCAAGQHHLELVVVSSCYSALAAQAFIDAGVRHAVCINLVRARGWLIHTQGGPVDSSCIIHLPIYHSTNAGVLHHRRRRLGFYQGLLPLPRRGRLRAARLRHRAAGR